MLSSRAAGYGIDVDPVAYFAEANRRTMFIPLVEEREGMRNVRAIAATPSVDLLFLGEGDLAIDMGFGGRPDHPDVVAVLDAAIAECRIRDPVGHVGADPRARGATRGRRRFLDHHDHRRALHACGP